MIESSDVTVIIPAYCRCPLLEQSVDCLLGQTVLPGEIIVVHSGSDDPASQLDCKSPIVRVIHRDKRMRAGAARNIGSDFAKGKWLAFLDADVLPDGDWLEHLLAAARAKPKRLIAGSIDYLSTGGYWGLCLWTIEFSGVHPFLPDYETQGIASANLMVPAAALKEVAGFPSGFPTAEDTIVGAKLKQIGYERWFCAAARVRHMNLPGFAHFSCHLFRLGRFSAICRRVMPRWHKAAAFIRRFWVALERFSLSNLDENRMPVRKIVGANFSSNWVPIYRIDCRNLNLVNRIFSVIASVRRRQYGKQACQYNK